MSKPGRPQKKGLDYFSMDVNMDQNFESLEELHGNDGFVWMVKFWQEAYRTNDGLVDLSNIRGIIAAKKARISSDKQAEIIKDCLVLGLLKEPYKDHYTSTGIQRRLEMVMGKRENDRNLIKNELPDNYRCDNTAIRGEIKVNQIKEKEIKEDSKHNTSVCEWKKSFEAYQEEIQKQFKELADDNDWFAERESYHPNLNIRRSVEKAMNDFWGTEAGWKHKKSKKTNSIDLKATLNNALTMRANQVFKARLEK